jgi:hypothetical protein
MRHKPINQHHRGPVSGLINRLLVLWHAVHLAGFADTANDLLVVGYDLRLTDGR